MKAFILYGLCLLTGSANLQAEGASAAARKKLYLQVESHVGTSGVGGGVGLFLPGDCRLDLSYSESSGRLLGASLMKREYHVEIQSFVANSFYYSLGVAHRRMNLTVREYDWNDETQTVSNGDWAYDTELKTTGPYIVIGNEWQWNHFFLGAEWVGVSRPISWEYTNTYSDDISERERAYWEEDVEYAAKQPAGIMLNLFLGFSF